MSPGAGLARDGLVDLARRLLDALDQCETAEEQESLVVKVLQDTERETVRRSVHHLQTRARERRAEAARRAQKGGRADKDQASSLRRVAEAEHLAASNLWRWWGGR